MNLKQPFFQIDVRVGKKSGRQGFMPNVMQSCGATTDCFSTALLQVKITDFGSSSICDGDGHQGKSFAKGPVGTPPYIAPELLFPGVHAVYSVYS